MHEIELALGLLVVVSALAALGQRIAIPYPILLVLGGLILGWVPGIPEVHLEPDVVMVLFLPPILFGAAYFTSIREFKANASRIGLLAVGLVAVTATAVALVARWAVPGLDWAPAFALGALVAPPDAIAATAITQRLRVPSALTSVIEGESLVNDATALVMYRVAIAAALTGAFSPAAAGVSFVLVALLGLVIGLAVGWAVISIWRRLDDAPVEILFSLLAPYAAYIPAEAVGGSGVLAAVAAGLFVGRNQMKALSTQGRVQGLHVWQMLLFVVNGFVFLLIGLQLPSILAHLSDRSWSDLLTAGLAVSATVVIVRLIWMFPVQAAVLKIKHRDNPGAGRWRWSAVIGWAGMRGAVTLAAAIAIPEKLPDGSAFPERELLIFIAFCVIMVTLVGQGLTLPVLIRWLHLEGDFAADHEEVHARQSVFGAALTRLDELLVEWPGHAELVNQLHDQYSHSLSHLAEHNHNGDDNTEVDQEMIEHLIIRRSVVAAQREAMIDLRNRDEITDEVMRHIERDLDLEELRAQA